MGRRGQGLLIVVLAVGWWTAIALQGQDTVFGRVPLLDERFYLEAAATPAAADQPHFMSPLYPRLISALGAGMDPQTVVLPPGGRGLLVWFQGLLWLGAALLLRGSADRLLPETGSWWRWLPSLLFLFYSPLLIYGQMALVEVPLVFLTTVVLHILADDRRSWPRILLLGLAVGLATLLRTSLVVLALPVLIWLRPWGAPRTRSGMGALFLAVLVGCLLPAVLHNSRLAGHPVAPTVNGGINLYLGNGPEATGLGAGFSVDWQEDPAGLQELSRRLDRPVQDPLEADGLWRGLTWKAVAAEPGRALGLWLRKWHLQLQGWEMDQIAPLDGWRQELPLLRLGWVPWGLLVGLAAAGLAAAGRRLIWPVGVLGLLMGIQAFFFVVGRYRMVLVPALCLLALGGAWSLARRGGKARLRGVLGLLLGLLLAWPWQQGETRAEWQALSLANHAQRWALLAEETGDAPAWQRAADLYAESLRAAPRQPGPWQGAAAVSLALGRPDRARRILAEGWRLLPENAALGRALLAVQLDLGRRTEAIGTARSVLRSDPGDPMALHNLTVLLAGKGEMAEALDLARRLVRAAPGSGQGYVDLGILLAREGRREEAAEVFRQGLRAVPADGRLEENLRRLESRP